MKHIIPTFAVAIVMSVAHCANVQSQPAYPPPGAGVDYFYDELAPYGSWVSSNPYGKVWYPADVPVGWRPYMVGHWVYADCGWTWVSDEPWGWACYHYGRWYSDPVYGWCWVPDTVWGPAWVAWNWGDDWCGWAPLPPLVAWEGEVDWDDVIPHHCWNFVDRDRFCDRHVARFVTPVARNVTLLQQTRSVTRFALKNSQVVNLSLSADQVEKAIHRPVPRVKLVDINSASEWRTTRAHVGRNELAVFRPKLDKVHSQWRPPEIIRGASSTTTEPDQWLRHQEEQRHRLQQYQQRESARLQQLHESELQRPPTDISPWELGQRHVAERRAQEEEFTRQNQVFAHQYERGLNRSMGRPMPSRAGPPPDRRP